MNQKVKEAIEEIREFRRIGVKAPQKSEYRAKTIEEQARRDSINPDTLRKSRRFACPEDGYSDQEFQDLINMMKRQSQTDSAAIFSKSHLLRLLSVSPRMERLKLQKSAIQGGWSRRQLDIEIQRRFGTRRQGGRRPRRIRDVDELLSQAEKQCETWTRWHNGMGRENGPTAPLKAVPHPIRKLLTNVFESVRKLHAAVSAEQGRKSRDWKARPIAETAD